MSRHADVAPAAGGAPSFDVLVVGSLSLDVNEIGGRCLYKLGGVAAYAGLTFAAHGLRVAVLSGLSQAHLPLASTLERAGVRVFALPGAATTRFVNRHHGGRTQRSPAQAAPIPWDAVCWLAGRAARVHLGPLHPHDLAPGLVSQLASARARVSVDAQGYLRELRDGVVEPAVSAQLESVLRSAGVVKVDSDELQQIESAFGESAEMTARRLGIPELVITRGGDGGTVWRDGVCREFDALPVRSVDDPTGAGDVFFAAYLSRRFEAAEPAAAARHAAAIAARHVAGAYLRADLSLAPDET